MINAFNYFFGENSDVWTNYFHFDLIWYFIIFSYSKWGNTNFCLLNTAACLVAFFIIEIIFCIQNEVFRLVNKSKFMSTMFELTDFAWQ